jgi:hypothetical protein
MIQKSPTFYNLLKSLMDGSGEMLPSTAFGCAADGWVGGPALLSFCSYFAHMKSLRFISR